MSASTAFARLESKGRLLNPVLKAATRKSGRFGFRGELALRFAAKLAATRIGGGNRRWLESGWRGWR